MADEDSLSEGELEDGEVLSSDEEEEGQGNSKVCIKPHCTGGSAIFFVLHVFPINGYMRVTIFRTPHPLKKEWYVLRCLH